jgi:hypothetical protein
MDHRLQRVARVGCPDVRGQERDPVADLQRLRPLATLVEWTRP